jgi:hypothetical protein
VANWRLDGRLNSQGRIIMKNTARRILLASGTLVLAACGGGGGDSVFGPAAPTAVPITAANAQDVASDVAQAFAAAGSLADFDLDFLFNEVSALAAPGGASARFSRGGQPASMRAMRLSLAGPSPNLVTTDPCIVAGSVTVTSNIASSGTLTVDDAVSATFNACDDGDGQVIDGTIGFTVQQFTGDLPGGFFTLTAPVTFTQLTVTAGTDVAVFDGNATIALDTTDNVLLYSTVSGSSLSITLNGSKTTLGSYFVTTITDITNGLDFDESLEAGGTLTSDALGGKVDLETVDPLLQAESDTYPRSGLFTILGGDNTYEDVSVTDGNLGTVTLDIDTDGNGQVDTTQTTTWAALFN